MPTPSSYILLICPKIMAWYLTWYSDPFFIGPHAALWQSGTTAN